MTNVEAGYLRGRDAIQQHGEGCLGKSQDASCCLLPVIGG